jgi:hypothetical protein
MVQAIIRNLDISSSLIGSGAGGFTEALPPSGRLGLGQSGTVNPNRVAARSGVGKGGNMGFKV